VCESMFVCVKCYSIDLMCEVMRHAVESGTKIHEELRLESTDFVVNQVGHHHWSLTQSFLGYSS
jgi:hypothetical protein